MHSARKCARVSQETMSFHPLGYRLTRNYDTLVFIIQKLSDKTALPRKRERYRKIIKKQIHIDHSLQNSLKKSFNNFFIIDCSLNKVCHNKALWNFIITT